MISEQQKQELSQGAYGLVRFQEPMSSHTTFRIGGCCDVWIEPTSEKELVRCIRYLKTENIPYIYIGNGSNLLVRDGGIRGAVIHLGSNFSDITCSEETIHVQSGALLSAVAKKSFRKNLTMMEELSGIPGTVGGAVFMNAGAYGREMKDVVEKVRFIDENCEFHELPVSKLEFGYRQSVFQKKDWIITQITLKLKKGSYDTILALYQDYTSRRTEKQPLDKPSAGSTFRRPVGGYASALIDQSNLRGFEIGGAQVSPKHCGFIVNNGTATAKDVLDLISYIQQTVKNKFEIELEPEIRILGEDENHRGE